MQYTTVNPNLLFKREGIAVSGNTREASLPANIP